MIPASYDEEQVRLGLFRELLRRSEIDFDVSSMLVRWADPSDEHYPEGYVEANFSGDTLTFASLEKASVLFGTRQIDIGCEHGCASDPCHERVITFRGARGL